MTPDDFMREAIRLAADSAAGDGGPFGCVIVRKGEIVARGRNRVTVSCDPTAHAEVCAIREACSALGTFLLADCELYTSCEPCPMCLAAIYWARLPVVYFAGTREDAAAAGFDDERIYRELDLAPERRAIAMRPLLRSEARAAFQCWQQKPDRIPY